MSAPLMEKQRLYEEMKNPDLNIIDLRGGDPEEKIKGAVQEIPDQATAWMKKYEKNEMMVLYCA